MGTGDGGPSPRDRPRFWPIGDSDGDGGRRAVNRGPPRGDGPRLRRTLQARTDQPSLLGSRMSSSPAVFGVIRPANLKCAKYNCESLGVSAGQTGGDASESSDTNGSTQFQQPQRWPGSESAWIEPCTVRVSPEPEHRDLKQSLVTERA